MRAIKAPDVEVFDAVVAIKKVKRSSLAERDGKQSVSVKPTGLGFSAEVVSTVDSGEFTQTAKVAQGQSLK